MSSQILLLQCLGLVSFLILFAFYLVVRRRLGYAIDGFMLFFSIQYGPHGLWITPLHRVADLVSPANTERFLIGMIIAYLTLAVGMLVFSTLRLDFLATRRFPVQPDSNAALILISIIYVMPFIALQGPSLPVTSEYIRAFLGTSAFEYDELRREVFSGTPYVRLASLTRQTTTALLISFIVRRCFQSRMSFAILAPFVVLIFPLCAMQMNKFPFVYFFMLIVLTYLGVSRSQGRSGLSLKQMAVLGAGALAAVVILVALYQFQYGRSTSEVQEVLFYRIFFCSCDVLRLWYDVFPEKMEHLYLQGIPITAKLTGQPYVNPTVVVPESLVTARQTSFQVGFIGSGYAGYGLFGIAIYSFIASGIVMLAASLQRAFRDDPGASAFLVILTINMFFLTTRELHTAMLSGGTLSLILVFLAIHVVFQPRKAI